MSVPAAGQRLALEAANDGATAHLAIAVCVPVRDERRRLPALLRALARQSGPASFHVCLLFDGPQPDSQKLAEDLARGKAYTLICESISRARQPNAGRARRAALAVGLAAVDSDPNALLLTTDADTVPAPDWVAANARALSGVDLVAGHIRRAAAHRMPERDRLERYLDRLYHLERTIDPIVYDPLPSHPSIGGASLGFRAGVYQALGGIRPYANKEDVLIVAAARKAGYRLRRDRSVRVTTSSRLDGRASRGLADELCRMHHFAAELRVDHPADSLLQYRRSAAARAAYHRGCLSALNEFATQWSLDSATVHATAASSPSSDAFTMTIVPRPTGNQTIDLAAAEPLLAQLERTYLSPAKSVEMTADMRCTDEL